MATPNIVRFSQAFCERSINDPFTVWSAADITKVDAKEVRLDTIAKLTHATGNASYSDSFS
jgi:hypothetical protein